MDARVIERGWFGFTRGLAKVVQVNDRAEEYISKYLNNSEISFDFYLPKQDKRRRKRANI